MSEHPGEWSPPLEIEEYRLIEELGRGTMGQVFLAHDTLLDRHVAVKFISGETPDARRREQFFVEARAIARLSHPNVVAIHRVGEVRRRPYLISELVKGKTLAELTRPVPPHRLLEIAVGLSRGLAAAHRRGVLHRDLKPANAMITEDGEVKLLDFGLAKLVDGAPRPAPDVAGARLGSPLYMAPEIWRGEPATRATDIYAIGVVLYELAAGAAPHQDAAPADLPRFAQDRDAPPLRDVVPTVDAGFAEVIDRCLCRDPGARWDAGDALRGALEALLVATRAALPEGNPYRGLAAFEAEHQGLFFGRDRETRAIVERLHTDPFVVIAGDSGVGKSSLCRAGVLPRLVGRIVTVVPGRRPLAALCAALAPIIEDEAALAARLSEDPAALSRELRRRAPVVLFVDQLEELAALGASDEGQVVAEALAGLALPASGVRLVATARSDFLTRLAGLPALGPEIARALYLLPPLSPESVGDAVVGPLTAKGFRFAAPAMAEELAGVADGAGGLPLLQFALATLWDARDAAHRLIPAEALARMGGPAGALAHHADRVLAGLVPLERVIARRMLLQLVTAEGTRAHRGADELVQGDAAARGALEALVRGRLVVAREDTCEIAHEALVARWDTLRGWLSQSVERRAIGQRLERAAAEWERLGRAREARWSRKQLAEAAGVDEPPAGTREAGFLIASRRSIRRRRVLSWAAAVALPLAAISIYGISELSHRRDVDRRVALYQRQADAAFGRANAALRDHERLRASAFEAFDAMERERGELRWKQAVAAARRADAEAHAASDALETALRLDGSRGDVRSEFGDVLQVRAQLADLQFQRAGRDEILTRLALYDEDGSRRARWTAPAEVQLVAPPGLAIRLYRYDDDDGHRRAVEMPAPASSRLVLAPGSYLVVAGTTRLPFVVAAGERFPLVIGAPARPPLAGFLYIPAGRFEYGSSGNEEMRRTFFNAPPLHTMATPAFLIARYETTYGDWIAFLDALSPAERDRLLPHGTNFEGNGVALRKVGETWELALKPKDHVYRARWGEPIHYLDRDRRSDQDWRRMPVAGVSFNDAEAYARWLDASGRVPGARLCTDVEWERAARGADDREYPHGDRLDPDDANFDLSYGQKLDAFGPDEVGSHPASQSPFGVDDMAGNIFEWTRSSVSAGEANVRGACFYYNREMVRVYNREAINPSDRTAMIGIRICATVH
ncbi:MAG TPA: SUMF1/EgtB/PvdO family nonheme iron enzyme [Kofleriaceae bacterium]|nr:SUMF1/EgtB/PvdO family nonheme iron enzyme [Kofleriaceae bacterium]